MKTGSITPHGVSLEKHEMDTIVFLTERGKSVELIPPSNTPHSHRPDFMMDGIEWEMKSPEQATFPVVERALDKALRQSQNVVIDLRRAKGDVELAVKHLKKCFASSRRARRLLIIIDEQEAVDLKK